VQHRPFAGLAVLALLVGAQAADPPPAAPAPLDLAQTIALPGVKGRIDHMDVDATRKRLFVAALGNGSVEVVSLEKGERVKTIALPASPQGVAYLADSGRLVVACGDDGTVRFFDGATLAAAATAELGADADNVRYDAVTQRLYVGCGGDGKGAIAAISAKKAVEIGRAEIGVHPEGFVVEATGRRIFVNAADAAEVVVVDRFDMTVKARWKLDGAAANFPIALDEAAGRLYVGCRRPPSVLVLSTQDGKVVSRVACSEDVDDVALDAKRRRAYVACGAGAVDVFDRSDADALKPLAKVETRRGARTAFFDAAADRLYVAAREDGDKPAEIRIYAPR
jgi:DNA-binding beta-propeller fold protein YncE